jgi:hypothetical protein
MQLRSIDIDLDVHRNIEAHRESFTETQNDILRRVFALPVVGRKASLPQGSAPPPASGDWSWKGVTLPAGTELRMTYNGRTHTGVVAGGAWQVSGASYTSPSSAADAVARSREGNAVSLNGWTHWQVKKPGSNRWVLLDQLRPALGRSTRRRAA